MTSDQASPPSDHRSRITEAAAQLLREGGPLSVTTRAVARAAEVPAPTIFRLFGDKDGLMDAVAEHVMTTYVDAKSAESAPGSGSGSGGPVDDLRNAWHLHVEFGLTNPDLFVIINNPGRLDRSPSTAAGIDVLETRIGRLASAGLLGVSEARAVMMIHAAGTGAVFALLHQPPETRDLQLSDAMLDAVLGAILTGAPSLPASQLTPLAITFRTAIPQMPALTTNERGLLDEWLARTIADLSAPPPPARGKDSPP